MHSGGCGRVNATSPSQIPSPYGLPYRAILCVTVSPAQFTSPIVAAPFHHASGANVQGYPLRDRNARAISLLHCRSGLYVFDKTKNHHTTNQRRKTSDNQWVSSTR